MIVGAWALRALLTAMWPCVAAVPPASAGAGGSEASRAAACAFVAVAAIGHNVDPALAVAVGYNESRFDCDAVSITGCVGPMQVSPAHCPGGDCGSCADKALLGVALLGHLTRRHGLPRGLCAYATGRPCVPDRRRGAVAAVLSLRRRFALR